MPHLGIRFLAITQAYLRPIGLKFFMGAHETIIYQLLMRNPSYNAYFPFLIFVSHFWWENLHCAWPPYVPLMGFSKINQKVGPLDTGWNFLVNCYLEIVFSKFSGVTPPPSRGPDTEISQIHKKLELIGNISLCIKCGKIFKCLLTSANVDESSKLGWDSSSGTSQAPSSSEPSS